MPEPLPRATVVLLHGLFMRRPVMLALAWRLQQAGYRTRIFSYDTTGRTCAESARQLHRYVANIHAGTLHFVAHSLGGLVLRHGLPHWADPVADFGPNRRGHIVTLGTPHQGSDFARRLATFRLGRRLLGDSLENCLLGGAPALPAGISLGSLAGDFPLGLGRTLPGLPRPNDGMVAVAETRLEGMRDHVVLPVSHTGMLFSGTVAGQVLHFLQCGRFDKDDA
jgi:hypothetical protein